VRFVLLAEGQTEKEAIGKFLKRWLDAQLMPNNVGVRVVDLGGSGNFAKDIAKQTRMSLSAPHDAETIGVIGLLDLYGCPASARDGSALQKLVNHHKFRMFFAVHESEAWMLSEPAILPRSIRDALPKKKIANPERVNTTKPPSKLLDELFIRHLNRAYRKIADGDHLFARLDPDVARAKCPKLCEMLDVMLSMAKAAGL